jgi:hypothetical protein
MSAPAARIRDGKKALDLAQRLRLAKKLTIEHDIRCGIVLSTAYAERGDYDTALSIARDYLKQSKA